MPRSSRKSQKSVTRIYHVILRGINSQDIFLDDNDRKKFLKELTRTKEKYRYELYAYVLMNNHVHLLIKDEHDYISKIIQSISTAYAIYFNKKYNRIGHLFYNRFHSKCVENQKYLMNLQRYIHRNPQKDGISKMDRYEWSSYKEYIGESKLVNAKYILSILSSNEVEAIKLWKAYNLVDFEDEYNEENEFELKKRLTDDEAIDKIKNRLQIENIIDIQKYKVPFRDKIIKEIALIEGISKKQISRIIGLNRKTIYRAIKE